MNAKYKLTRPQDVDATLEVTMTVGEWAKLYNQLDESAMSHPAWQFREIISDLIKKAEKEFEAESER